MLLSISHVLRGPAGSRLRPRQIPFVNNTQNSFRRCRQSAPTMLFGPLGPSLAPYVRSSRTLSKWLKPVANWYANLSGYRRVGLVYDDLRAYPSPHPCHAKLRAPPPPPLPSFVMCWPEQHRMLIRHFLFLVVEERPDVQRVCVGFDERFP